MKRLFLSAICAIFMFTFSPVSAQSGETPNFSKLDASPMDLALYRNQNEEAVARVIYSRPQKRDREIFGKLIPYGKVWRTGANEATELTLYQDMQVADVIVKAGTYTLYTIPEEDEWTIILNHRTNTWGAYEYTDKEDKLRITVPVRQAPNTIEALSMAFEEAPNGTNLLIGWDDSFVKVPFKEVN